MAGGKIRIDSELYIHPYQESSGIEAYSTFTAPPILESSFEEAVM